MTTHLFSRRNLALLVTLLIQPAALSAAEFLPPSRYLAFKGAAAGAAVSPFSGKKFKYFHLEDFEDGILDTPGVKLSEIGDLMSGGAQGIDVDVDEPQPYIGYGGSVDLDDGTINGLSGGGSNLFSKNVTSTFTFKFSKDTLKVLPTHVGIVWTDVGKNGGGESKPADTVGNVTFEAFGPDGKSLGKVGPGPVGDTSDPGTTNEDRFFGVINEFGISAIRISMPGRNNWSVDHLQYGFLPTKVIKLTGDLAFGSQEVGSDTKRSFTIKSSGNSPIKVRELELPPGFKGKWSGVIDPGQEKKLVVRFLPTRTGTYSGSLAVICDATNGAKKIAISGKGVRKGLPFAELFGAE